MTHARTLLALAVVAGITACAPAVHSGPRDGGGDASSSGTCSLEVQALCASTSQCCGGLSCLEWLDAQEAVQTACCATPGQTCAQNLDCCGITSCNTTTHTCTALADGKECLNSIDCASGVCRNGFCGSAGCDSGSVALGAACTDIAQCCLPATDCSPSSSGSATCCVGPGVDCSAHGTADCCGFMACGADMRCAARQVGETCRDALECADGIPCAADGTCTPANGTRSLGQTCSKNMQCVTTGTGSTDIICIDGHCSHSEPHTSCASNTDCNARTSLTCETVSSAKQCCVTSGKTCFMNSFCCSNSCDTNMHKCLP